MARGGGKMARGGSEAKKICFLVIFGVQFVANDQKKSR